MNRRCAFAFPVMSFWKSSSESVSRTIGSFSVGADQVCDRIFRTSWLRGQSLEYLALLLQVDVPALCIASLVLQSESVDTVASLHGILSLGIGGLENAVERVEDLRRGKGTCT